MTISCPSCGLAFETRATTNTRCRRCRHVVRIGRASASRSVQPVNDDRSTYDPAAGLAAGVAVVGMILGVAVPAIVRAVRRRRANRAPTLGREAGGAGASGPHRADPGPR